VTWSVSWIVEWKQAIILNTKEQEPYYCHERWHTCLVVDVIYGYWGACFNKICSGVHLLWLPHYCLFAWLSTNTMPCCSCCNYVFTTWILIKLLLFLLYQLNWRYVQNNSSCCWGGFKVLDSSFSLVFFSISSEIHQTLDGVEFYDSSWVLSVFVNVWCFQHWNTILGVLLWPQILYGHGNKNL